MTMLNRTVCSAIAASALLAGAGLAPAAGPEKPSAASRKAAPATSAAVVPPALVQEANAALGLLDSDVVALTLDRRPGRRVVTDVELEGVVRTLDLEPHSARSPVYEVRVQQPDGTWEIHAPGPVRTLRGTVDGLPGATVAATMLDEGLKAMILLPDDRRLWIEPLAGRTPLADETHHVVYGDEDVIGSGGACGTDHGLAPGPAAGAGGVAGGGVAGATLQLTELACDTDVEYFQDWGSVAAVESRINSIVNTVNLQYESQVAIRHEITTILIRSSEPDPYSSSSSSTLLNQFRNEWLNNQAGVPRDVAHLFTGKEIIGSTIGEAWTIGGICTTGAYCHAQSDCCGSFACATDLTAHELGHLWGAFHCSCPANTMNPTINCSNLFSAGTITDIVNHRNTRTCLETFEPGGDCNDNGVPDSTDIATGFSDDCNNNDIPDECETGAAEYADSLGAPLAIPDGSGQFVSNAISVPTSGTITDIDVDLQISHTWNGDLTVRLQKGGTQIDLIDRPGIPGSTFGYDNDGYDITLDDEGTGGPIETENSGGPAVTSPPSYVPNDALSAFDGLNQAGTWTISVSDSVGQDAGSLVGWSLKITTDGGGVAPCDVPNDDCADATVVGVGSHPFSTAGALTDGPDESVNCGFPFGMSQVQNDVWFEYTASCLGTVVIGVCDADFDVALVVYDDGCPSTSLESAYCSSNDCNATGAEVSFIAAPGQTFLVRVGSLDDVIGAGTLDIDCTPFSVCGNGSIDPGEECDDGNLVNGDGCDAGCQLECRADGTPCDDRDPCTTDDMFIDCECVGVPLDCDDGIPCTFDECVDGVCVNTPNDALCDNGLYCDGVEVCVAGVGCMAGTPVLCNDGNPCTDDVCDEVNDTCIFPANSAPCDDGDPCTVNDTCSGGNCAGTPLDCDDGDPCTDDSCVDGTCVNVPNGTCCPQDCDGSGDGIVGVSDLLALLGDWGGPGPCDLDGNGTVGVGDLLDLLGAWGPCR